MDLCTYVGEIRRAGQFQVIWFSPERLTSLRILIAIKEIFLFIEHISAKNYSFFILNSKLTACPVLDLLSLTSIYWGDPSGSYKCLGFSKTRRLNAQELLQEGFMVE